MTIVIVNGQECETGCVLAGHWGWHNHARMLREAEGLGWEIDAELDAIIERYDSGDSDTESNDCEIIADAMDEAERWLNDRTADGFVWHWHDGEFFLSPLCENGDCDDDTCAHWD